MSHFIRPFYQDRLWASVGKDENGVSVQRAAAAEASAKLADGADGDHDVDEEEEDDRDTDRDESPPKKQPLAATDANAGSGSAAAVAGGPVADPQRATPAKKPKNGKKALFKPSFEGTAPEGGGGFQLFTDKNGNDCQD